MPDSHVGENSIQELERNTYNLLDTIKANMNTIIYYKCKELANLITLLKI